MKTLRATRSSRMTTGWTRIKPLSPATAALTAISGMVCRWIMTLLHWY